MWRGFPGPRWRCGDRSGNDWNRSDESFRLYGQDLDFCTRAVDAGWTIRVLRDFSVLHHQGATVATITRTADRHPAEYLWTDLLRWSAKTRGAAYARRAALALSIGARVRLFARRLITPAVAGARRDRWSDQDREIRAALDALRDLRCDLDALGDVFEHRHE